MKLENIQDISLLSGIKLTFLQSRLNQGEELIFHEDIALIPASRSENRKYAIGHLKENPAYRSNDSHEQ